jgi:hypothetical protein
MNKIEAENTDKALFQQLLAGLQRRVALLRRFENNQNNQVGASDG